jgi:acyl-coenzyme A synthetase/AMP-(fatty) acid ligase
VLVKAIPRSASGKLLRRKLRSGEYERLVSTEDIS